MASFPFDNFYFHGNLRNLQKLTTVGKLYSLPHFVFNYSREEISCFNVVAG
jgi:hypothetical protein